MNNNKSTDMSDSSNAQSKVDFNLAQSIYIDQYDNLKDIIEEIDSVLTQSQASVDVLNCCAQDLQKALNLYEDNWVSYRDLISSEPGLLNAKMREHRSVCRNARQARKSVLSLVSSLTPSTPQSPPVTPNNPPLPMPKLPTIQIPTFVGIYQEWPAFWDLYSSLIHQRADISNVMKFSILRSNLGGTAMKVVDGLSITNQNYDVAVRMLKETYDDINRLSRSLLKEFSNLPSPKHTYDELLNFRLSYQKLLLQIENSGVNVDQSDPLITSTITQKLSSETSKLLIQKYNTFDLTLTQISEGLKYALDLFEYCRDQDQCHKVKSVEHNKSHNTKVATVTSSHTDNKFKLRVKGKSAQANNQQQKSVSTGYKNPVTFKPCIFCKADHASKGCPAYSDVDSRKQKIKELRLCFSCLQSGHMSSDCKTNIKCRHCDGGHHTFLCYKLFNANVINPSKSSDTGDSSKQKSVPSHSVSHNISDASKNQKGDVSVESVQLNVASVQHSPEVVLSPTAIPTATVQLSGGGKRIQTRSLFDTGSQRTFICPSLVQELNLEPFDTVSLLLSPFSSDPVSVKCDIVKVVVRLGKTRIAVKALVHDKVSTSIRTPGISSVSKSLRSKGVKLADHHLNSDDVDSIRLLIGVDYFHRFIHSQSRTMGINVFSTSGGALIYGPMPQWACDDQSRFVAVQSAFCARVCVAGVGNETHSISDLWTLDAVGIKESEYSPEDKVTVQHLEQSIHKYGNQYIVSLPFKSGHRPPTNYRIALGQLYSLMRKFRDDPTLWSHYQSILSDYLDQGFIEVVPFSEHIKGHYLPYHHVDKESTTTPIRIVFDASSKKPGELSLNDCLHTGPSLTTRLFESLLAFRANPFVVMSDVSKAFLRIGIDESSRDWCRFVWMSDPSDPSSVVTYRFKVVCFGATCSPFLLQGTLDYHLKTHPHCLAKFLASCFYVDNFLRTYETAEQMFAEYPVINDILNDAGMPLQEWVSNDGEFNKLVKAEELIIVKQSVFSVLGILWNVESDKLKVKSCKSSQEVVTKRSILSCVSSVFDPLGLVSPVVILGKILVSDLWKSDLNWDDKVNEEFQERFTRLKVELSQISCIEFPRFVVSPGKCQLHVFCDSSQRAFGAVAYSVDLSYQTSNILVSKARVCPHRKLTIPKLELTSVNVGCKLAYSLMSNSSFNFQSCVIWSDSEVTIARIKSDKCKDPFVRNRVKEIRDLKFPIMHVSSKDNPADILSRGCCPKVLASSSLWKHGPNWLLSQDYPPQRDYLVDYSLNVSVNEITAEPISVASTPVIIEVNNYSSLTQVKRIMLSVLKFISLTVGYLFPLDPLLYLVRLEQQQHYPSVIAYLNDDNLNISVDIKNFVYNLSLYLDEYGLVRAKGRIQHAHMEESAKYPYLLPPRSHLTTLIIRYFHVLHNHCGVSVLIVLLREQFWIPKGRQVVKTLVNKCVFCKRVCGKPATNPGPPPLPKERVTYSRPFSCVGIDYTGAVSYVDCDTGNDYKAYICLFTCASSRAIHLELVSSLTAADFLLSFRRFCSYFSVPDVVISDNARNFTSFCQFWQQLYEEPEVKSYMETHSVRWQFSVPRSPWKGGFFERLIGVTKGCLAKALYRKVVTYDELRTLLCEFTSVINSRPLTYVSEDSMECLTPNNLLYGRNICLAPPLNALAEDEVPFAENIDLRLQYSKLSEVLKKFEKLWCSDYLTSLKEKHYNNLAGHEKCPFQVGDVVLVNLDTHSRKWWPLGLVHKLIPGPDGVIRSAEVKVGTKIYHRSLSKIVFLEVDISESLPASEPDVEAETAVVDPPLQQPEPLRHARPLRQAAVDCNQKRQALINQQLL